MITTVASQGRAATAIDRNPQLSKAVLAVGVGLVFILVGLVAWTALRPSGPSAGPLVVYRSGLSAAAQSTVGEKWSWGLIQLHNPTDEVVYLDRIDVQSSDGRFVGGLLVEQWRQTATGLTFPSLTGDGGMVASWPPPGADPGDLIAPSKGVVPPHKTVYVYVELTPPSKGQFLAGPAKVLYHIGSNGYQVTSRNWERVCAPSTSACNTKGMPY